MEKHIIKNEKEYKFTKSWLKKFNQNKKDLAKLPESKEQPWLRKAQRGSLQIMIDHLQEEVTEYEALKSGKIKPPSLDNLAVIPENLIKNRIANGWTLERLAKKMGLHYQQIQRYEKTDYATATFETLLKIASVLEQKTAKKIPKKPVKTAAYKLKK
jgi:ribosome-binding protein aMBF1 (putative translation factor)